MIYYRAKTDSHDWFTGNTTVPGELLTKRERDTQFSYLHDCLFDKVEVSRRDTYISFGVRKAYTDAKIITL